MRGCGILVIGVVAATAAAQTASFSIANPSDVPRSEIARVSLPLAPGALLETEWLRVGAGVAPARPLVRWADGSAAVLQVHVAVQLAAHEERHYEVAAVVPPPPAPTAGNWYLQDRLPLHTELEDPFGTRYRCDLEPRELLPESSPLLRVRRYRGVHRAGGRISLGVVAYLTTFRGERRAELSLVLDNGANPHALSAELGPVRLRSFALVTDDPCLRLKPRFAVDLAIPAPVPDPGGGFRQELLPASDQHYLGDRTGKAFRVDLFLDAADATAAEREAARLAVDEPMFAWPSLSAVRQSGAFGAHGGPAPAAQDLSPLWLAQWRQGGRFGPYGGCGDAEDAAAQGTPRNGNSALHNALRWRSLPVLRAAELMALQNALRPTLGWKPRLPPATAALRSGLAPRCIEQPHGFTALDYEHCSVDLLYDYYWLTGDALARDELARVGANLLAALDAVPFPTCRGEGWCLQAGVLAARATGDRALVAGLAQHFNGRVGPRLRPRGDSCVLVQPGHEDVFGENEPFDAPWQMAALVHGLHALWRETRAPALAETARDVAQAMAGPGWLDDVGPKAFISALAPAHYAMPVGFAPLEGTALHQAGAFVLAAEMTNDPVARELFWRRARTIATANLVPEHPTADSDRWLQVYLDRDTTGG